MREYSQDQKVLDGIFALWVCSLQKTPYLSEICSAISGVRKKGKPKKHQTPKHQNTKTPKHRPPKLRSFLNPNILGLNTNLARADWLT